MKISKFNDKAILWKADRYNVEVTCDDRQFYATLYETFLGGPNTTYGVIYSETNGAGVDGFTEKELHRIWCAIQEQWGKTEKLKDADAMFPALFELARVACQEYEAIIGEQHIQGSF